MSPRKGATVSRRQTEERQLASHELPSSPFATEHTPPNLRQIVGQPAHMAVVSGKFEIRIACGHMADSRKTGLFEWADDCRFGCGAKGA